MDIPFRKNSISCLDVPLREVQNLEEALELKLSEGMPDIGSILGAWGQVILRGKEWHMDTLGVNGGVQVWVLYAPEDGSSCQIMEGWVPFQTRYDLPDQTPEGQIRLNCLLRFVDARGVSPRRIMVRTGVAIRAEALSPVKRDVYVPGENTEPVAARMAHHRLLLAAEAGEKAVTLEEALSVPASVPQPQTLVSYQAWPEITEGKLLGDKAVFRGNLVLRVLYLADSEQLCTWEFEIPFSQYAQLDQVRQEGGRVDVLCCITGLEAQLEEQGRICCKCDMTGQYLVLVPEEIALVEDAYSPGRELQLQTEHLELPQWMEPRWERIGLEHTIPMEADILTDLQMLPDFPWQRQEEGKMELTLPGTVQVIGYGSDSMPKGAGGRWEASGHWEDQGLWNTWTTPMRPQEPQVHMERDGVNLRTEIPVRVDGMQHSSFPMVIAMTLGQQVLPDPQRPSLVLRKAGTGALWDVAKACGTTEERIRIANALEGEPNPEQMLLIPIP